MMTLIPPPVIWAQRPGMVFLTICLEDCKNPTIKMEENKIYFRGVGGTEKKDHEITMELFKEIDAEKSRHFTRERIIEFILKKKEEGPFWPQLLKQKGKYHWLKVDFNKWKDEDESDDELGESNDFEEMMRKMGGLGDADESSKPNFDLTGGDSDDEDMPDLE